MLNKEKIKEIMEDYPEVAEMSINEYQEFKVEEEAKIPCMNSIYKYFGRWVEFKKFCFEDPVLNGWWENESNVINKLREYPAIEDMTQLEYELFKADKNLPSLKTIRKYIGTFNHMKAKIFTGLEEINVELMPNECIYCLERDFCEHNHEIDDCEYF